MRSHLRESGVSGSRSVSACCFIDTHTRTTLIVAVAAIVAISTVDIITGIAVTAAVVATSCVVAQVSTLEQTGRYSDTGPRRPRLPISHAPSHKLAHRPPLEALPHALGSSGVATRAQCVQLGARTGRRHQARIAAVLVQEIHLLQKQQQKARRVFSCSHMRAELKRTDDSRRGLLLAAALVQGIQLTVITSCRNARNTQAQSVAQTTGLKACAPSSVAGTSAQLQ